MGLIKAFLNKIGAPKEDSQDPISMNLTSSSGGAGSLDAESLMAPVREQTKELMTTLANFREMGNVIEQLNNRAEYGRLKRSRDVQVSNLMFEDRVLVGEALGSQGQTYRVQLLFEDRSYNCTCADIREDRKRGITTGPCKHVLALSQAFWGDYLEERVEEAAKDLDTLIEELEA